MRRMLMVLAAVLFCAATAGAQNKVGGTVLCGKPDPQHTIQAGDVPDHALGVEQAKCSWPKPSEMAGDKSKESLLTTTTDLTGDTLRVRDVFVNTMESGDKVFGWYQGTATLKEGKVVEGLKGTWGYTGGSGKFKGLKGKGTYSCADEGCALDGEYQLAK